MVRYEYGRRRALLIGINYSYRPHPDTPDELKGCIDDVDTLGQLLLSSGWSRDDMMILTDKTRHQLPTRKNIINAAQWLVHDARPGDVFFFSYSGHGAQQRDPLGYEEDGLNETLLPMDVCTQGTITDDELNAILVRNLPSGCKLLAVIDACHSGTQLDLPFTLNTSLAGNSWREETNPLHTKGDVQLISGCRDNETSSDGNRGGAMTKALVTVLRQNPHGLTFPELLDSMHRVLRSRGFWQRPDLTSSQAFPLDRPFIMDEIVLNQNRVLGQVVRKRFAPKKEKYNNLPMFIGAVVGIALGCAIGWLVNGDIVLIAMLGVICGIIGLAIGYALRPSEKMYPIIRLYLLKFPDILHFWFSSIKKAFCPTRRNREFSMKPNSFFWPIHER